MDGPSEWEAAAPAWVKFDAAFDLVGRAPGLDAIDALGPIDGARVLDIGCGAGSTTVELARRVGPRGSVTAVDVSAPLLQAATERAAQEGVTNVRFVRDDAQVHAFGAEEFDAAYSRFGLMFFHDPTAAFVNIRRALRPGGVLAATVWDQLLLNEWIVVPVIAAAAVIGALPSPPPPGSPGPFSLADRSRLEELLREAGYSAVELVPVVDEVAIGPGDRESFAEMVMSLGPLRETLEPKGLDVRRRAIQSVTDELERREAEGPTRLRRAVVRLRATA